MTQRLLLAGKVDLRFPGGNAQDGQYARLRPVLLADESAARAGQDMITDAPLQPCWMYKDAAFTQIPLLPVERLDVAHMDAEQRQRTVRQVVERVVIDEGGAYIVGLVPSDSGRLSIEALDHDRGPLPRCLKARFKMASTSWAASTISLRSLHVP